MMSVFQIFIAFDKYDGSLDCCRVDLILQKETPRGNFDCDSKVSAA